METWLVSGFVLWTCLILLDIIDGLHPDVGISTDFQNRRLLIRKSSERSTTTETICEIWERSLTHCGIACLGNGYCVAVIFSRHSNRCRLQKISYSGILSHLEADFAMYEVQFEDSVRKVFPASCSDVKKCSSSSADGEFYLFPDKYHRQTPIKVYCHNMASPDTAKEYITLHANNYFIRHDLSHLISDIRCSRNSQPLMRTVFSKIRIKIESMDIVQNDYSFSTTTGTSEVDNVRFGTSYDCSAEFWWPETYGLTCQLDGKFEIDLSGTGIAIASSVGWIPEQWESRIRQFSRSADSTKVSCLVIGWCGECAPNDTITIEPLHGSVTSGIAAQTVTCP